MIILSLHAILLQFKKYHEVYMEKFTCTICGHVYNPERGEPLQNIPSGKDFITLPENWLCPVCNASKKDFTKE